MSKLSLQNKAKNRRPEMKKITEPAHPVLWKGHWTLCFLGPLGICFAMGRQVGHCGTVMLP